MSIREILRQSPYSSAFKILKPIISFENEGEASVVYEEVEGSGVVCPSAVGEVLDVDKEGGRVRSALKFYTEQILSVNDNNEGPDFVIYQNIPYEIVRVQIWANENIYVAWGTRSSKKINIQKKGDI